jgi:hypothetical protein
MRPVKHAGADVVYSGPSPEIGDLWCMRDEPGLIRVVYELDDNDREMIAAGGRVFLGIWTEPIPPISMQVIPEEMCQPIDEHLWKEIAEVRERAGAPAFPTFSDLGASLVSFQGGTIILRGFGCGRCGNGHWAEDDPARRRPVGTAVACPHCGKPSVLPEVPER